jgi:phosphatidylglycerol:prolipoprotein diacylglycerol transferase
MCIALAFAISFIYFKISLKQSQRNLFRQDSLDTLFIYVMIISILGSRLFYVITNVNSFFMNPLDIFKLWNGGLIYYGGFLSVIIFLIVYAHKHHISMLSLGDFFSPGLALGYSIGRIGCLLGGCCYGKQTDVPWAITFNNVQSIAVTGVSIHPTQIYESLWNFFIFIILHKYSMKTSKNGILFGIYSILYGIGRFLIEFFRGDVSYIRYINLSLSQIISLCMIIFGIHIVCKKL